jgi:hypothetical protein
MPGLFPVRLGQAAQLPAEGNNFCPEYLPDRDRRVRSCSQRQRRRSHPDRRSPLKWQWSRTAGMGSHCIRIRRVTCASRSTSKHPHATRISGGLENRSSVGQDEIGRVASACCSSAPASRAGCLDRLSRQFVELRRCLKGCR